MGAALFPRPPGTRHDERLSAGMETRARYALIGLFTLVVIVAAFIFIYWLKRLDETGIRSTVYFEFSGTVGGLAPGGAVYFAGIKVGNVTALELRPGRSEQGAGHGRGARGCSGQDRHQGRGRVQFPDRRRLYRDDRRDRGRAEHLYPDAAQDRRHPVGLQRRARGRRVGCQQAVIDRRASRHLPRREPGVR